MVPVDGEVPPQTSGRGEPDAPGDLSAADWKATARRTLSEIKADRVTMTAASMAYYSFIAIFPALIAAVGMLSLVRLSPGIVEDLAGGIQRFLPGDAGTVLSDAVRNARGSQRGASLVATVVGLLIALWGASAALVALQKGLDIAYDVPAERSRSFVKARLVALALLAATAVLGGIASALIVFGAPLGGLLSEVFVLGEVFEIVWSVARWVGSVLGLVLLFAVFYYLGPNRESPRWTWISPGGVTATIIWIAASLGFSFYVSHFGRGYGETYGSLAGVVLLIVWLYLSSLAVLVGGELNAELERQAEIRRRRTGAGRASRPAPSAAGG